MTGRIMIDGCQNCHHDKSTHLPDGSCLFEPTKFKPYPSLLVWPKFVEVAHVQQPAEPTKKKSWLRRLFT